ncbi:hypothetical protein SS1G_12442 [Sclerotinia sclerotiorum 1980 UF-70]|uniref:Methyltransferase domain-containing protein n=1 Tax=Sclerotinia sclerotiorum (strain ATCC 18683 / 1980 / Ss-1) TaxID=665079 RepID=A7F4B8_SCLS1|nr:hypothetical protein SS1G_12442 [Sclerotinia sclerotiorum 1980 UF-70]EDN97589.1 hypothetical protein SS1G_12442 [Sclerotinia sclerotiorum 1980 UF-70]
MNFFLVLLRTLLHKPSRALHLSNIASQSFGEAWAALDEGDPYAGPLANILPVLSTASGTILEIGPGSGEQVRFLTNEHVERVYGVEPCGVLHELLKKSVREAGLQGKYRILGCGAGRESLNEELKKVGILVARCTQILYQLAGWSFFMGNCHLNRRTDDYLKAVGEKYGGWEKVELKTVGGFAVLPFVSGELVKRR